MLPVVQSLAGLNQLWQSMNNEQKELLDNVITQSIGPLLDGLEILPEGCGSILCSEMPLNDKATALAMQVPKTLGEKKEACKAVVACCCPECGTNFLKEIDYG